MNKIVKSAKPAIFSIQDLVWLASNQHLFRKHFPLKVGGTLDYKGQVFTVCELFRYRNRNEVMVGCRGLLQDGSSLVMGLAFFNAVISYGNGVPHPDYNALKCEHEFVRKNETKIEGQPRDLVVYVAQKLGLKTPALFDRTKVLNAFAKGQVKGVTKSELVYSSLGFVSYEVDFQKCSRWVKDNFHRLLSTRDSQWNVPQRPFMDFVEIELQDEVQLPMWCRSKESLGFANIFANYPPIDFKFKNLEEPVGSLKLQVPVSKVDLGKIELQKLIWEKLDYKS